MFDGGEGWAGGRMDVSGGSVYEGNWSELRTMVG